MFVSYDENNESNDFDLDFDNDLVLVGENNPAYATVLLQLAELERGVGAM